MTALPVLAASQPQYELRVYSYQASKFIKGSVGARCYHRYFYYLYFPLQLELYGMSHEFANFKFILRGSDGAVFISGFIDLLYTRCSYGAKAEGATIFFE